jgi:hypothetical protein
MHESTIEVRSDGLATGDCAVERPVRSTTLRCGAVLELGRLLGGALLAFRERGRPQQSLFLTLGSRPPVRLSVSQSAENCRELQTIHGIATATATTVLAALWPHHHWIMDSRSATPLAALLNSLGLVAHARPAEGEHAEVSDHAYANWYRPGMAVLVDRIVDALDSDDDRDPPVCAAEHLRSISLREGFAGNGDLQGTTTPVLSELFRRVNDVFGTDDSADTPDDQRRTPSQRFHDAVQNAMQVALDNHDGATVGGAKAPQPSQARRRVDGGGRSADRCGDWTSDDTTRVITLPQPDL